MIWREPQNHYDGCYFCTFDLMRLNKSTKISTNFSYPSSKSAKRASAHSDDILIPVFKELVLSDIESSETFNVNQDDNFFAFSKYVLFDQKELHNQIRNLNQSKESSDVLASWLKDRNLLDKDTNVTFYPEGNAEFIRFYNQTLQLVYCSDIKEAFLWSYLTDAIHR